MNVLMFILEVSNIDLFEQDVVDDSPKMSPNIYDPKESDFFDVRSTLSWLLLFLIL